jgi:hypothetical protein
MHNRVKLGAVVACIVALAACAKSTGTGFVVVGSVAGDDGGSSGGDGSSASGADSGSAVESSGESGTPPPASGSSSGSGASGSSTGSSSGSGDDSDSGEEEGGATGGADSGAACAQLQACNGCALVGAAMSATLSETMCTMAIQTNDTSICVGALAAIHAVSATTCP